MKLNYRMQSLFASAIQIGVLVALATLLILGPIYAREEGSLAQTEVTTGTSTPGDEIADVTDSTGEETPGPTSPPQKGYIIASTLNIRETPGSAGKIIGYYEYAKAILVYEKVELDGTPWGRTEEGWVCLTYVDFSEAPPSTEPKPTEPKPTEPKPTEPKPTTPKPTEPKPTEPSVPSGLEPNPFKSSDFVKKGYIISCKTEKTAIGIDVSSYQSGKIDWKKLKASGVDYVMIRVGYRGYGTGKINKDDAVEEHYKGAKAAGLKVGFYFYSQAITVAEAVEEARFVLKTIKNWEVDLPIACDWEYEGSRWRVYKTTRRRATDCIKAFCQTIADAGYDPMVYCPRYIINEKLYIEELAAYPMWYAEYQINYLRSEFRVDMWQYSKTGRIDGVKGNVDLNVIFLENSVFSKYFNK